MQRYGLLAPFLSQLIQTQARLGHPQLRASYVRPILRLECPAALSERKSGVFRFVPSIYWRPLQLPDREARQAIWACEWRWRMSRPIGVSLLALTR